MGKTIGQSFREDPALREAKEAIVNLIKQYNQKITGVKAATPELAESYQKSLEHLSAHRGGKLFYGYIGSGFGNGPLVELNDGSVKYDFITGIGVHYFGHSHPQLIDHMIDGCLENTTMQGHLQQNYDSAQLIDLFLETANINGANFQHCFLTSSGVMADENALKIALQKRSPAHRVLAFEKCFHGRTLSVAQITDKEKYRAGLPKTLAVDYIPFYDSNDHQGSIERACQKLESHLSKYPGEYAVMIMELIQGEAGSYPGHKDFFKALVKILKDNNISIIADEVQSFARTDHMYAFQYFELDKDIDFVTIGKMTQVCATLFRKDHEPQAGLISQTFTSSSPAIQASLFILGQLRDGGFLGPHGKINKIHQYFKNRLEELHQKYPQSICGPYGIGGMIAMTVFGGDMEKTKQFTLNLFDNGVISFMAGGNPVTRVRFLVPMGCIETHHIDDVIAIIDSTIQQMEAQ